MRGRQPRNNKCSRTWDVPNGDNAAVGVVRLGKRPTPNYTAPQEDHPMCRDFPLAVEQTHAIWEKYFCLVLYVGLGCLVCREITRSRDCGCGEGGGEERLSMGECSDEETLLTSLSELKRHAVFPRAPWPKKGPSLLQQQIPSSEKTQHCIL